MSWTLCTSGAAIAEAGLNANSTIVASGAALAEWSDQAEAAACDLGRYDIVTNFSSLTTNGIKIFQEYVVSYIAQKIIKYDMSGYTSRGEATLMLNLLEDTKAKAKNIIEDDKYKTYLGITV